MSELHTVADDEAVAYDGTRPLRYEGLPPDTEHTYDGLTFRTLPRPAGERLATVTTVNDLHFGETECGRVEGHDIGPVLSAPPGAEPYPAMMNAAAVAEMAALDPAVVIAKGDLTGSGTPEELAAFEACYAPAFGDRLVVTLGNHDNPAGGAALTVPACEVREVPGATLVIFDTSRPGLIDGRLDTDQLDALDEVASRADRPVVVFGHHPVRDAGAKDWMGDFSVLDAPSNDALFAVVARRPAIAGYFAGHTHRNRVRRFAPTGPVPFVEVACVKDFPGSWAEYRIHEGGILQVHRRISTPAALAWSEGCRAMIEGLYARYALGRLTDRCFPFAMPRS